VFKAEADFAGDYSWNCEYPTDPKSALAETKTDSAQNSARKL
jgi:hypothetical protein